MFKILKRHVNKNDICETESIFGIYLFTAPSYYKNFLVGLRYIVEYVDIDLTNHKSLILRSDIIIDDTRFKAERWLSNKFVEKILKLDIEQIDKMIVYFNYRED